MEGGRGEGVREEWREGGSEGRKRGRGVDRRELLDQEMHARQTAQNVCIYTNQQEQTLTIWQTTQATERYILFSKYSVNGKFVNL